MEKDDIKKVFSHFVKNVQNVCIEKIDGGTVNKTYLVKTNQGSFITQCLNSSAFSNGVEAIEDNYRFFLKAYSDATTLSDISITFPLWMKDENDKYIWRDNNGFSWRVYPFIVGNSLASVHSKERNIIFAKAVSDMHKILTRYSFEPQITIKGFHDIDAYFQEYLQCESTNRRVQEMDYCISSNIDYIMDCCIFEKDMVVHGDTKIGNIVYDETDGNVAFIDLDTFSYSSVYIELADSIRSLLCSNNDNTTGNVQFDIPAANCFLSMYYSYMGDEGVNYDREKMMNALLRMPFELGLRFYTDYLCGNKYFTVDYPDHNLKRAEYQFELFKQLWGCKDDLLDKRYL